MADLLNTVKRASQRFAGAVADTGAKTMLKVCGVVAMAMPLFLKRARIRGRVTQRWSSTYRRESGGFHKGSSQSIMGETCPTNQLVGFELCKLDRVLPSSSLFCYMFSGSAFDTHVF